MAKSNKIIIQACLCGAATSKQQTPYVPVTPDEIAADTVACVKAGASIVHIHARDAEGKNSMATETFVEICDKVREALAKNNLDCVINLPSSGSISLHANSAMRTTLKPHSFIFSISKSSVSRSHASG